MYNSFMSFLKSARAIFSQRARYFLKGNYHGVSANWLSKNCDSIFGSTFDFLTSEKIPSRLMLDQLHEGESEYLKAISMRSGVNYGNSFDCEIGLASFLYAYVLHVKPQVIVETGVANGITTNVLLAALAKSGGVLHSFDIDPKTANVHPKSPQWSFHLLEGNTSQALDRIIGKLGKIDLWIHDSNHGFQWQNYEYQLALYSLSDAGLLVSDDIDSSTAWGLLRHTRHIEKYGIFDTRKMYGVAQFKEW